MLPDNELPNGSLRILMVAARYFPFMGGIESHIHEVGRRLVARGHRVGVLTADPSGCLPEQEMADGMEIIRVPTWLPRSDFCLAPGLASRLEACAWDVVHVQGYHTFSAPLGMMASIWKKLPFVLTFHSGGHSSTMRNRIRRLQHAMLSPLVRRAARLVAVSKFEAALFSAQMAIPRARFTVVPNGASLPTPTAIRANDPSKPLIVSLGRLERYKGHHRVIEAFVKVRETYPSAQLRILGDGPYKADLLRLVAKLDQGTNVVVDSIPAKQRHEMADLLAAARVVVLFSEYEAHPVAVMEALSLGVPVLTSDTSGFRELAEQGWVRAIPLASSSDELARALAGTIAAERTAMDVSLPNWDDCADQLLSVYRSALQATSRREARSDTANAVAD